MEEKKIKLLPFEDLIKALDEKGVQYDRDKIADAYSPLEDVEACLNDECSNFLKERSNHLPCPLC